MKSIINYALPAALLASLASCSSAGSGDTLSIKADTIRKVVEVTYTSSTRPAMHETVEYGDLPVVPADFRATYQDTTYKMSMSIEANFALGFLSPDALTRRECEDSCINSIEDPFGEDSPRYPNYIVKAWADALPVIQDFDWADVKITSSIAKKSIQDKFERVSGNKIKYTALEDGKAFMSKEFVDTMAAHQLDPEVTKMESHTGTVNSEIYSCNGDGVDFLLYEDSISPLSKLYRMAFRCCPDRMDESCTLRHYDIGFADVYSDYFFHYMCGAHGVSSADATNVLKSGDTLDIYDVVRKDMEAALVADLYSKYGDEYGLFESTFPLKMMQLFGDHVVFFWTEYEIGPYVSHFCEMKLPYKGNEKYFTSSFTKVLKDAGKI